MPTIFLCSESNIKVEALKEFSKKLGQVKGKEYKLISLTIKYNTFSQPFDEGTSLSCLIRLVESLSWLKENIKEGFIKDPEYCPDDDDLLISLENGIYTIDNKIYDVCVMMVYDFKDKTINRYNSFGIQIDKKLFRIYHLCQHGFSMYDASKLKEQCENLGLNYDDQYKKLVFSKYCGGSDKTFGKFLQETFNVVDNNWMSDPRFGNVDRKIQIQDCLDKYLINSTTDVIPDYPRKDVMFKHMTSVVINPILLNTMYDLLKRMIKNNFDIDNIDYFAGLDARGFYLAPTLAHIFKKGFIPVRKAKKLPNTGKYPIVTISYKTEYSDDEFGLEYRDEYKSNGNPKKVLVFDDLLATGGSIIGSTQVLKNVGLEVAGVVTIYDVEGLRESTDLKMTENKLNYRVLINENGKPNDFVPLSYEIPDIMIDNLNATLSTNEINHKRMFTLTDDEWIQFDDNTLEELQQIDRNKLKDVRVIYTDKDKDLAEKIIDHLIKHTGADFRDKNKIHANSTSEFFSNGEIREKIDTSIRNKHVIVVSQIRTGHINNDFMQLILTLDACTRASVKERTVVLPYYPYSRSDKKDDPRCPIGAAVIGKFLQNMKVNNVISIDLHAGQIQGFMEEGFHNLYIKKYMCDYIYNNYLKHYPKLEWNDRFILVAPDAGSARSVKSYSKILGINNTIMDKNRNYAQPGTVESSRYVGSKEDFKDKIGFVIDDMADTMGTMCSAAKELINSGMKNVIVLVTHGILSGPAIDNINKTPYITEVVVTDTLPQDHNVSKSPKIRVLSCVELIARTIDGILTGRSISRLF